MTNCIDYSDFLHGVGSVETPNWAHDVAFRVNALVATVGALWALGGESLPPHWAEPWQGRVETSLAGVGEVRLDDLVDRTVAVADGIRTAVSD